MPFFFCILQVFFFLSRSARPCPELSPFFYPEPIYGIPRLVMNMNITIPSRAGTAPIILCLFSSIETILFCLFLFYNHGRAFREISYCENIIASASTSNFMIQHCSTDPRFTSLHLPRVTVDAASPLAGRAVRGEQSHPFPGRLREGVPEMLGPDRQHPVE